MNAMLIMVLSLVGSALIMTSIGLVGIAIDRIKKKSENPK